MWAGKYKTTGHGSLIIGDEFGNIIFVSDPAPGCDHDMRKREGKVKEILDLAGSVIADKGFQGSGYVTPAKKPQDRELYTREHEYNNQVSSIRAPIERAVAHLKTWKIVAIQPEWRHAGSVAGFGAWVPVRHASACGWPDLPGSSAWCVRVVVYGGAVAGGSQGWPVNSRVRASSASMPHLPAVDR